MTANVSSSHTVSLQRTTNTIASDMIYRVAMSWSTQAAVIKDSSLRKRRQSTADLIQTDSITRRIDQAHRKEETKKGEREESDSQLILSRQGTAAQGSELQCAVDSGWLAGTKR